MGASYEAKAVIGMRIPERCLQQQSLARGCDHPLEGNLKAVFCPTCGKQAWINDFEWVPEYDEMKETLGGLPVLSCGSECDYRVIAVYHASVSDDSISGSEMVALPPTAVLEAKERLRQVLTPIGLWKESNFGLWAILDISC